MKPHKTCKFIENENIKQNKTYESISMVWSTNVNSSQQGTQQLHLIIICEMLSIRRDKFIKNIMTTSIRCEKIIIQQKSLYNPSKWMVIFFAIRDNILVGLMVLLPREKRWKINTNTKSLVFPF
jgi:hypothetical protein